MKHKTKITTKEYKITLNSQLVHWWQCRHHDMEWKI